MTKYEIVDSRNKGNNVDFYLNFPFTHIWGSGYKVIHPEVSWWDRRQILKFMYAKNEKEKAHAFEASRQIRSALYVKKKEINLQLMQKVSDYQLVENLKRAHKSALFNATIFGMFLGSVLLPTVFRKVNILNKMIVLACGCLASRGYANINFTNMAFDQVIDIYQMERGEREARRMEEDKRLAEAGYDF